MTYQAEDEMLTAAKLGIDAEVFLVSPLGRFLTKKAEDERAAAIELLIDADPEDIKQNREFRNQIHVSNMFLAWINDAVNIGKAATEMLRSPENDAQ